MTSSDSRITEYDIDSVFTQRWSPRSFSDAIIDDQTLFQLFEAARWAPSGNNSQPWRFIYAKRGTDAWPVFTSFLNERNQLWASKASALIVLISKTSHVRNGDSEPSPLRNHSLDAGAAWASLAFQAVHQGLSTHAIGGFDRDKARELLKIPEGFHIEVTIAVGQRGDIADLTEDLRAREQPSPRLPLSRIVAEGEFSFE